MEPARAKASRKDDLDGREALKGSLPATVRRFETVSADIG